MKRKKSGFQSISGSDNSNGLINLSENELRKLEVISEEDVGKPNWLKKDLQKLRQN